MLWPKRKNGSPGFSSRAWSLTRCRSSTTVSKPWSSAKYPASVEVRAVEPCPRWSLAYTAYPAAVSRSANRA